MIDNLIHLIWKLLELVITFSIAWWVLGWFIDTDAIAHRLTGRSKKPRALKQWSVTFTPSARKRVEMVRNPDGKFVGKKPPSLDDPHDPEELARIEAELDEEIRRGRSKP